MAWVIGLLLALLYGYLVVTGIGNVIGLGQMAAALGLGITPVGWFWLSFGIVLPLAVLVVALLIGRGRGAVQRILLLATGLAVVAAVQLEVTHLVPQANFFV